MTSHREPYEVKVTRSNGTAKRLVKKGWEIVSTQAPWIIGAAPTITLRRPNPKYTPKER